MFPEEIIEVRIEIQKKLAFKIFFLNWILVSQIPSLNALPLRNNTIQALQQVAACFGICLRR